eukprot:52496_1
MAERKEEYFQARDIYLVNISIIRAINLAKADTFGKSDGFVKVECLNRKFRTITIKKDLDPTWDARTQFQFFRKPMQLKFRVLDWNAPPQKDTPLGHYVLDLNDEYWLKGNCGFNKQIVDLVSCKRGQIEIAVSCSKLEPFSYLDRMRKCAEQKIQYKKELETCEQQYKNQQKENDQIQKTYEALESKCTQLQDDCTNFNQQKNTYEEQGRKCDSEVKTLKEQCGTAESRYNNFVKEYKNVEYDCDQYIKEYSKTKKQCEELENHKQQLDQQYQQKLQEQQYQQQQDNTYDTKEPINEYEQQPDDNTYDDNDNDDDDDDDDNNFKKRIKEYIINIRKEDDKCDIYDNELCTEIITQYKEQYDIYVSGITEEDNDEDDNNNEEYISARDKSNKYLNQIQQWSQGCNEEIYAKMLKCLGEDDLDYTDNDQKQFFNDFYVKLNAFFVYLQIIDATLQIFEEDIKKYTKRKKISAVTFNDLAGNTDTTGDTKNDSEEDEEPTVWRTLYEDLDSVIEELGKIFTPYMRKKPLQQMCKLNSDFITNCYDGNYTLFSKLISHYICKHIVEEILDSDDDPNMLLNDGINGTILVLNDKKAFLNKLYQSMEDNKQIQKEDDDNDQDDTGGYNEDEQQQDTYGGGGGGDDDIQDKYEQIVSLIIALVCQLDCLGAETNTKRR